MLIKEVYAADLNQVYPFSISNSLGELISNILPAVFSVAGVLLVGYLLFGAFRLITSGGNKEAIAGAREMIIHTIIGFIALIVLFFVIEYIPQLLGINLKIIQ